MNFCIVSFQAVLLTVLLQYHYINEVEAKKKSYVSVGNWFGSIEKKGDNVPYEAEPEAEPEAPRYVVLQTEEAPKRKRRIKKHKKKNKGKHDQQEHLPHEQTLDASVEQDKGQFGKKAMRKNHKKRDKVIINQRKFVKTLPKESNSSESDEVTRRKPVDIIVHIKMND